MTVMDKARNTAQELAGKLKKLTGRAAGDRRLATEGRVDEASGHLKQAGEHAKDTLRP
ncbi:MAG TPA: CsbD family protein [Streptosporangiaceae bacterium]|jgi:uncharacterized protein YjbJ (UPF0337 family)